MTIRLKKYPPTAADLRFGDIIKARRSDRSVDDCRAELRQFFGVKHLIPVNTGRSALYAILKSALPPDSKVILPGYTCYTVAAAVIKAGMRIVMADSDPNDLGYDLESLKNTLDGNDNIRAIVVGHLFGIALDIEEIKRLAGDDVLIIDDAAQSFGIRSQDRLLGAGGDVGFYSFGRGKPLSLSGGGLLITDNDSMAEKLEKIIQSEFADSKMSAPGFIKAAAYNPAVTPTGFGLASRLPGIGLGQSIYNPDFPLEKLSDFKIRLLADIHKRIDTLNQERLEISGNYERLLGDLKTITIPRSKMNVAPGLASLRFPVLVNDPEMRTKALKKGSGWGLSAMYPTALNAIPELIPTDKTELPGAEYIARSIVTLPTHRHVKQSDIEKIAELWR